MPITEATSVPAAIWNAVRFGFGDDDASAQTAAAFSVKRRAARPRGRDPERAEHHHHDGGAQAGDARGDRVGLRLVALDPALALVRVDGERRVSGRVRVQIVDEAVQQFGGGVEVEQRCVGMRFAVRRASRARACGSSALYASSCAAACAASAALSTGSPDFASSGAISLKYGSSASIATVAPRVFASRRRFIN